ncbi:MAG: 2-oxo acid dehydrogenase subunit E2 [Candidatus Latescibacterota bacterium]
MIPVLMPQVGENLETGSILEWHRQEGERVAKGDLLLTVESEKAVFEVQAEADGVLARILYQAGEEAAVLQPVGYIGQEQTAPETPAQPPEAAPAAPLPPRPRAVPAPAPAPAAHAAPPAGPAPARPATQSAPLPEPMPAAHPLPPVRPAAVTPPPGPAVPGAPTVVPAAAPVRPRRPAARRRSSPAARRMARQLGVELTGVDGSGPGGRVIRRDVLAAAAGTAPATPGDQVVPFGRLRRHIALRAARSRTIPHLYLFADIDMSAALARCQGPGGQPAVATCTTDMVVHAVARALRQFPRLNAHVDGESLVLKGAVHLGMTTAGPEGMLVPVIPDADCRSLPEIAALRRRIAAAARRGVVALGPRATFTVLDLGLHDPCRVLPLINPPECAVLGLGAVQERVVSRQRTPVVRDVLCASLGCDQRVVDAQYAAGFLGCLREMLEAPPAGAHPAGGSAP